MVLGINANEIKLAGHVIEEAVDATAAAIHANPTATKLLEASGLHLPHMPSAPAIFGERIGSLFTPEKIKAYAEDMFGRLEKHPEPDFELEDRLASAGWNHSRKQAAAERAIARAGIEIDGLDQVKDTRALYQQLKGAPAARGALTSFTGARREFHEAVSEYNKTVVGPKFADTYSATNRMIDETGMIRPRIKISSQIDDANASDQNFNVTYHPDLFNESAVGLVRSSSHELTHLEQHQLQIFLKADQIGVGVNATPEQIQQISDWFAASGNTTSIDAIKRGLELRGGRFLDDEAAQRAHETLKSGENLALMWDGTAGLRQRRVQLEQLKDRVGYGGDLQNVGLELAHPDTGLFRSNELFGVDHGPAIFAKYSQNANSFERFSSLTRRQKNVLGVDLLNDLNQGIEHAQIEMSPYFKAYRESRHEVEAFSNGDLAASFHPQSYILKGGF